MRIALDVMGGDKSPKATIEGAVEALADSSIDFEKLFLVGDEATVQAELDRVSFTHRKIEVVHAPESVEMHESAVKSVRQKKKSSIAVSLDLIKKASARHSSARVTPEQSLLHLRSSSELFRGLSALGSPPRCLMNTAPVT